MKELEGLKKLAQCALSPESDAAASKENVRPESQQIQLAKAACAQSKASQEQKVCLMHKQPWNSQNLKWQQ